MKPSQEPSPVWADAPRYCAQKGFPAYRFTAGLNPHPRQNPKGHSYGKKEDKPVYLPPERWRENALYLHGVDLYHQGYLWESHEAWETLWHLTDKEGVEGQFLQGLIQNAAALLKAHLKEWAGARHLRSEAHRRIQFVAQRVQGRFMGIDVAKLLKDLEAHFQPPRLDLA